MFTMRDASSSPKSATLLSFMNVAYFYVNEVAQMVLQKSWKMMQKPTVKIGGINLGIGL